MAPQIFSADDIPKIFFLVLLEGLLSADNALVMAIMVQHLPKPLQQKALLYGLGGAFVFRAIAILLASYILALWWLQLLGAGYLIYVTLKHFLKSGKAKNVHAVGQGFWGTVVAVELADIAFAIDSVLAAVAFVHDEHKLWVVYTGAIIGVIMLRFAAGVFVKLLERFPALDHVAYLLVGWVGVKLLFAAGESFSRNYKSSLSFEIHHMPQPIFWGVMIAILVVGVGYAIKHRNPEPAASVEEIAEQLEEPAKGA